MMRYAARSDDTADEIRKGLRAAGWWIYDLRRPWDLLVSKAGRSRFVECKSPGGRLTAAQTKFLCEWTGERIVFGRSAREVLMQLESRREEAA